MRRLFPVLSTLWVLPAAAFFMSGAASLIFEIVWLYRCGLLLGNTVWAASIVLSSFMGGLACGNALMARYGSRVARGFRAYAALEVIVGAAGLALTYLLGFLVSVLVPATSRYIDMPWLLNAVRVALAFPLLLVPAAAMGATLPILTAALTRADQRFARVLGLLYGVNTLGAVAGVLGSELVLIGRAGMVGAAWIAAALNLAAAAAALCVKAPAIQSSAAMDPPMPRRGWPAGHARRVLAAATLMGATLMALEVVWFRFLSMFTVASTLAASLMLATVLFGIACGGLLASAAVSRREEAGVLPLVVFAAAGSVTGCYGAFQYLTGSAWAAEWNRMLWAAIVLTLPTATLSGASFVLLGAWLKRSLNADAVRAAGWLTLTNTAGGLVGPLAAGFVLLPRLGMERSLFLLAFTYVVSGFVLAWKAPAARAARRITTAGALAAILVLALFPFGSMSRSYFTRATREYTADGSVVVAAKEGVLETVHLLVRRWAGRPLYYRVVTNGYSMSGTHVTAKRYMRYFAYLPFLLHDAALPRVLVICYGAGVTTDAVVSIGSARSIDVAEISPEILAMSPLIYGAQDPLKDPRVRVHLEDGRYFLQATREQYDLITAEPPPPLTPGTVTLYTREYFRLIRDRLADGGVVSYWLPVARRGEYDVKSIIAAFCDVFEDCSLWNGTVFDWMLVGTRGGRRAPAEDAFARPWSDPQIWPRLREIGFEVPEEIGATFLADSRGLRTLAGGAAPLTDDYPQRLEPAPGRLSMIRAPGAADAATAQFVAHVVDTARTRDAFAASPFIARTWPRTLAARTAPYFEVQRLVNDVIREGANPLANIDGIHWLLTQTTLRRAPLWLLGSDDPQQEAIEATQDRSPEAQYALGIRALVARQYAPAASFFAEADRQGLTAPAVRALWAYALCLQNRADLARELAGHVAPAAADERHFWTWLSATFGVSPTIHAVP